MTTVGLCGNEVSTKAIDAALSDIDVETTTVDIEAVEHVDIGIVTKRVGSTALNRATDIARRTETALVCVELGGVGGIAVDGVDAAISGYRPGSACYDCLCKRVEAGGPESGADKCETSTARLAGAIAGHEVTTFLNGKTTSLFGGVIELPYTNRQVLPVPYCDCAERTANRDQLRRTDDSRPLEESISLAEVAFDTRIGPISSIGEVESFPVPYYLASLADTPFSDGNAPDHAAGVGIDWDPAFMKALGEALERYSAAIYRTSDFFTAPAAPIDLKRFVRPEGAVSNGVEHWCTAENLRTGETVHVPAELVVFPPAEQAIRPSITTGLGLGNSGIEAICSGLYEVVERDATMLAWYSTYEPMGLSVADDAFQTLANRAKSEGLSTTVLLLTQDIDVPVVAAFVHRAETWPQFAAGSAARLDPVAAARGALEEAVQNWLELRRMGKERARKAGGAIGTHADLPEVTQRFIDPDTTVRASTVGVTEPPTGSGELEALLDRVSSVGLDAYAARLTPRDVEAMGFESVRVLVPEAQPLFTGEPYFGDRARTVPKSLGFEPRLDRTYHPFP